MYISGKGDFEFIQGKACTTLRDYHQDGQVYKPLIFPSSNYFDPELEKDFVDFQSNNQ